MREWGAKLAGNMLRIAGMLALCDSDGAAETNAQREISVEAIERAISHPQVCMISPIRLRYGSLIHKPKPIPNKWV